MNIENKKSLLSVENSIVMHKIAQLALHDLQRTKDKNFRLKLFQHVKFLLPFFIYGTSIFRLFLYGYYINKPERYPYMMFDLFIGAIYRAEVQLDKILLLSLSGAPFFGAALHYFIERKIGSKGNCKKLAVYFYDAVNRNVVQVDEAVKNENGSSLFSFTLFEAICRPLSVFKRFFKTVIQLYTGKTPLVRPLKVLHFHTQALPVSARFQILFFTLGAELSIQLMYFLSGM